MCHTLQGHLLGVCKGIIKSVFEVDVVYVPIHINKLLKREYNQAELLAFDFCKIAGLPLSKISLYYNLWWLCNFIFKNF